MDGIELMATAMHAMQARVDIAAANLANVSSDGFRRSVARVALGARGLVTTANGDAAPGVLRRTGRALDLSVAGSGGMLVRDAAGRIVVVRSASFHVAEGGVWRDGSGRVLLGDGGPVRASGEARVDERGAVSEGGTVVAHVRTAPGTFLQSGTREGSNVDAIGEMVDLLAAQRAFETAEKALGALDEIRSRAAADVARVKQ